eukprot:scaffold158039_cov29-Tisochrysis_lutea.AAC.1
MRRCTNICAIGLESACSLRLALVAASSCVRVGAGLTCLPPGVSSYSARVVCMPATSLIPKLTSSVSAGALGSNHTHHCSLFHAAWSTTYCLAVVPIRHVPLPSSLPHSI